MGQKLSCFKQWNCAESDCCDEPKLRMRNFNANYLAGAPNPDETGKPAGWLDVIQIGDLRKN